MNEWRYLEIEGAPAWYNATTDTWSQTNPNPPDTGPWPALVTTVYAEGVEGFVRSSFAVVTIADHPVGHFVSRPTPEGRIETFNPISEQWEKSYRVPFEMLGVLPLLPEGVALSIPGAVYVEYNRSAINPNFVEDVLLPLIIVGIATAGIGAMLAEAGFLAGAAVESGGAAYDAAFQVAEIAQGGGVTVEMAAQALQVAQAAEAAAYDAAFQVAEIAQGGGVTAEMIANAADAAFQVAEIGQGGGVTQEIVSQAVESARAVAQNALDLARDAGQLANETGADQWEREFWQRDFSNSPPVGSPGFVDKVMAQAAKRGESYLTGKAISAGVAAVFGSGSPATRTIGQPGAIAARAVQAAPVPEIIIENRYAIGAPLRSDVVARAPWINPQIDLTGPAAQSNALTGSSWIAIGLLAVGFLKGS